MRSGVESIDAALDVVDDVVELTTTEAGRVVGRSNQTIRRYLDQGELPAQRRGGRRYYIKLDDLKRFAVKLNFGWREAELQKILAERN